MWDWEKRPLINKNIENYLKYNTNHKNRPFFLDILLSPSAVDVYDNTPHQKIIKRLNIFFTYILYDAEELVPDDLFDTKKSVEKGKTLYVTSILPKSNVSFIWEKFANTIRLLKIHLPS